MTHLIPGDVWRSGDDAVRVVCTFLDPLGKPGVVVSPERPTPTERLGANRGLAVADFLARYRPVEPAAAGK